MWASMTLSRSTRLLRTNSEGVDRVLKSNFAFFMESTTVEYLVERDCRLTQIGGLLDSKGYGIALPMGSPYTAHLSWAILKLQETGALQRLKRKWWTGQCTEQMEAAGNDDATEDVSSLGVANLGGVFLVLLGGLGVSSAVLMVELIWKASRTPERPASATLSPAESKSFTRRRPVGRPGKKPILSPTIVADIADC